MNLKRRWEIRKRRGEIKKLKKQFVELEDAKECIVFEGRVVKSKKEARRVWDLLIFKIMGELKYYYTGYVDDFEQYYFIIPDLTEEEVVKMHKRFKKYFYDLTIISDDEKYVVKGESYNLRRV